MHKYVYGPSGRLLTKETESKRNVEMVIEKKWILFLAAICFQHPIFYIEYVAHNIRWLAGHSLPTQNTKSEYIYNHYNVGVSNDLLSFH